MSAVRRVAITGISTRWGAELARRLERDPAIEHVAGIDSAPPPAALGRTELIEVDPRSPTLARLLPAIGPDTVVHCGIVWYPEPGKPARALHDINVIGTLQLLAACERVPTLARIVVRGSAAIYGCEGGAPSFFTEEMARRMPLRTRFQRDASGALEAAVRGRVRGPVNVAPTGAVSLTKALRLARRPTIAIPHPLFGPALGRLGRRLGAGALYGDGVRFLRFGRGIDNRRLRE